MRERIIVEWRDSQPVFPAVYYVRFGSDDSYRGAEGEVIHELGEWVVWVFMFVAFVAGVVFGAVFFVRRAPQEPIAVIPASLLTPDEQSLLKVLPGVGKGLVHQRDLVKLLGWSKSKVSAVVNGLEYKQIIRREKVGRSYRVYLEQEVDL